MKYFTKFMRCGAIRHLQKPDVILPEDKTALLKTINNHRFFDAVGEKEGVFWQLKDYGYILGGERRIINATVQFKQFKWWDILNKVKLFFFKRKMISSLNMQQI